MYNFYLYDPNILQLPNLFKNNYANDLENKIPETDIFIFLYKQKKYQHIDNKIINLRKNKKIMIYDPCQMFKKNKKIVYL